jgi:hypothetical protein
VGTLAGHGELRGGVGLVAGNGEAAGLTRCRELVGWSEERWKRRRIGSAENSVRPTG